MRAVGLMSAPGALLDWLDWVHSGDVPALEAAAAVEVNEISRVEPRRDARRETNRVSSLEPPLDIPQRFKFFPAPGPHADVERVEGRTRYTIAKGQSMAFGEDAIDVDGESPWLAHQNCEEVLWCHSGSGHVLLGDEGVDLLPGVTVFVQKGVHHCIRNNSPTQVLHLSWARSPPDSDERERLPQASAASDSGILQGAILGDVRKEDSKDEIKTEEGTSRGTAGVGNSDSDVSFQGENYL
eukprot:CAMPEP_0117523258 /NCGR_PEP_ID=MMETSP0784-20121206/34635_1 /TAXON_ID=39447 /ORGANISM="" /LENGTH=239 /DNA_ID=CAMNT_0005319365 /DNA_START=67 /DNA_END=786 /DNA_ORIENTATION=-